MKPYIIAIDLGGTTVKNGLFTKEGELLEKWEIPTRREEKGAHILPDIAAFVRGLLREKQISPEEVQGAGVGIPGPVDEGGYVKGCANLGWGRTNAAGILSELLSGIPVFVGNDAGVAALGEQWKGSGSGHDSLVMVTLGTGVGGGIIEKGHIVNGAHGAGGEIGHLTVNPEETKSCGCGRKGCLEQYASATGIVRLAEEALAVPGAVSVLSGKKDLEAKDIFDAAKSGDALSQGCVETMGRLLGRALSWLSLVSDQEIIVVGGGVSKAGPIVTDTIAKYYRAMSFYAVKETPIVTAKLGNDAGICGAARLVMTEMPA
ncbi:MAG: ROK family glucokinase [Eubacterium sp.]|nr:ROK family glucokinase [Eubacterium sp.]